MKLLSSLCSGENASAYLSAHYKLTKDVDMGGVVSEESGRTVWGGEAFTPIASFGGTKYQEGGSGFSGVFDGNGKKLTNLYVYSVNNYVGLFGVIDGGTVRNLVIETGYVSGKQFVGGIAGAVYGKGTITDGINGAMVYASSSHSGGIAGYVAGTSVSSRASVVRCINMGGVSSTGSYVGGIVGANEGRVYECFNIGGVAGGSVRGAVAGSNGVEKPSPAPLSNAFIIIKTLSFWTITKLSRPVRFAEPPRFSAKTISSLPQRWLLFTEKASLSE